MAEVVRLDPGTRGDPIQLKANFFRFRLSGVQHYLEKYNLKIEPPVPEANLRFRERILRKAQPSIASQVGRWVFANTVLYAVCSVEGAVAFTAQATVDEVEYAIVCEPTGRVHSSAETRAFFNKFFNSIQAKLNLVMIGRQFFKPKRAADLSQHQLEIWRGYSSAVHSLKDGCFVNIDISSRCLRKLSVFDQLNELKQHPGGNMRAEFERLIVGAIVITRYNNRCYRIEEVLWNTTPQNTFIDASGTPITFNEYYLRYDKTDLNQEQPMLKCTIRERECLLVPELCWMTGLTDDLRSNLRLLRDVANHTKLQPSTRLQKSAALVRKLHSHPQAANELQEWRADIEEEPVSVNGRILQPGSLEIGGAVKVQLEPIGTFDREVQKQMYEQADLSNWVVLASKQDEHLAHLFIREVQSVLTTFRIPEPSTKLQIMQSNQWSEWETAVKSLAALEPQMMICILRSRRGNSALYNDLKRLTISDLAVPTQVIRAETLERGRSLQSVLNKVVIQVNAKLGGVPWVCDDLPLLDIPTMIVGLDIFQKRGGHSVLGICGTLDSRCAKYFSVPEINTPNEEIISRLARGVSKLLQAFQKNNRLLPQRVVVFRDGVSDSERTVVESTEVPQFQKAFSQIYQNQELPTLVYIIVNKRTNARFYYKKNNPPLGTVVDNTITGSSGFDYYLMLTKANQGTATPTHFHVVFNNANCTADDLELLTYKLCYTYYNWSGSIRVPAPCQYAHKLAYSYGERANRNGPPPPHADWDKHWKLYFL